jgi:general secretion pathway protein A
MKNETDLQRLAHQWGASAVPFSQLSDQDWLGTPATETALAQLQQNALLRSVLLLAGPNGVGKSALAGRWVRQLDRRLFCPLTLTQATLSGSSVLAALVGKLGKTHSFRRERNLQLIEEAVGELDHRTLVIVLDEAQNCSHSALEELRLLLGLNLPQQPMFALVLIGDDYLLSTLKLRNHRALFSRLAFHLTLPVWTAPEAAQFLERGLVAVGLTRNAMEPAAVELLSSSSGGFARSLCLLARAAWIAAATQGAQKIAPSHVQRAFEMVPYVPGLYQPVDSASAAPGS